MNNGTKSLSINETFIIEPVDGVEVYSACTAFYTNNLISCSGNTEIIMGIGGVSTNLAFSAVTFYGDGSNLTGISTQDTYITGGTYSTGTTRLFDSSGNTITIGGYFTPSDDIYVSGLTFNTSNYDLTVKRNDGVNFTQSLSILASDLTITGGTYNPSTGTATFTNNTGGTFNVTGFLTGFTDIFVTGATFNNDNLRLTRNDNNNINVAINKFDSLTADTISATTYQNLPLDIIVTGGTYSNGNATFTNNTGGTFSVSGLTTPFTGGTISGATRFTNGLTANTISATTYQNLPIKYYAEFSGSPSVNPSVTASNSIAIGSGAMATASDMFVVGQNAGSGATYAIYSNFIGNSAGVFSTGVFCNFLGYQAGYQTIGLYQSNFIGLNAGYQASNAYFSNFLGSSSGYQATDANYSNFIGVEAGVNATYANNSNFIGGYAGNNATNAYNSNFIGYSAGVGATEANNSNFIGNGTGQGATEANNSNFIGNQAGVLATDAYNSNFLGQQAGGNAVNASYSTLIGYNVGFAYDTSFSIGSNNIIIGTDITLPPNAANSINIGGVLFGSNTYQTSFAGYPFAGASSNGRIGVNVPQPTHSLHVSGDTRIQGGLTATSYNGYNPLPTQAAISSGVTLSFITDTVYGTLLTPEIGLSISADTTNGQLGVTDIIIHSGSTPTFSSQYKKLSGSSDYSAGTINYIFCTYISSDEIIYSINQRT